MSKPIVVYTALTSFIGPWADFILVKIIMMDKVENYTVSVGLQKMLELEYREKHYKQFFAGSVLVAIPVTIPNSVCKVFVESVSVKNDKVTVKYSVVRDGCIGVTLMSADIIMIAVDKDVKEVEVTEKSVTVPFCIHGVPFSFDV